MIRELWEEVGRMSGMCRERRNRYRGRKGFYLGRQGDRVAVRRPRNTPIGVLMSDERFLPAVLNFLSRTKVGKLKEGVMVSSRTP